MLSRCRSLLSSRFTAPKKFVLRNFSQKPTIIYTETDEAPALATYSLYPVVKKYASMADIDVVKSDISLAGRIIAQFASSIPQEKRQPDHLKELGDICKTPGANIIKLPNISASIPQLNDAIKELRTQGFDVPLYVANPTTDEEKKNKEIYAKVLGSAVNPVLREGNSDRRVAAPVKAYAQKNPHTLGMWSRSSKSHVAHMTRGDFYASEKSATMTKAGSLKIQLVKSDGSVNVLKEKVSVKEKEVIDASFMSVKELRSFYEKEINEAMKDHMLISLHLKATMMKISDPVMFGHAVSVFF
jgi:isocitrate dehydrogenase